MSARVSHLYEKYFGKNNLSHQTSRQQLKALISKGVLSHPEPQVIRWFEDDFKGDGTILMTSHQMSYTDTNGYPVVGGSGMGWSLGPISLANDTDGPTIYVGEDGSVALSSGDVFCLTPIDNIKNAIELKFTVTNTGDPGDPPGDFNLGFYINCGTNPTDFVANETSNYIKAMLYRGTVQNIPHQLRAVIENMDGTSMTEGYSGTQDLVGYGTHTLRAEITGTIVGHYNGNLQWVTQPACNINMKIDGVSIINFDVVTPTFPTNYVGLIIGDNSDVTVTGVRCIKI